MDDGVLRLFDDPDNEEFLKAVKKGYEISMCCVSVCYEISTVCFVFQSVMRSVQYVLCFSLCYEVSTV